MSNPQDNKQKLGLEEILGSFLDLVPGVLQDGQGHPLAVLALDLLGLIEQQGDKGPSGLQRDKDEVDNVADGAGLIAACVDAQVDGAAKDLAAQAVRQPVAQGLAAVPGLRVGNGDGGLGHPKYAGRDAAESGAEEHEPLVAETVVGVEAGGVGCVSYTVNTYG